MYHIFFTFHICAATIQGQLLFKDSCYSRVMSFSLESLWLLSVMAE